MKEIIKMSVFDVQFTRLDEQQVIAYSVAVPESTNVALAIQKAEQLYAADHNEILVPHDVITNAAERRKYDPATTFYRNRAVFSTYIFL